MLIPGTIQDIEPLISFLNSELSSLDNRINALDRGRGPIKLLAPFNANNFPIKNLPFTQRDPNNAITHSEASLLPPIIHSNTHEDGGSDEISVTGLSGLLADLQNVLDHTHQSAGSGVGGRVAASAIDPDTTNFDTILSSADDTVQKALDTLDDGGVPIIGKVNVVAGITKGQAVCVTGATGELPKIELGDNTIHDCSHTLGIAMEAKANNQNIRVMRLGFITDVDTSSFGAGDRMHLGAAGSMQAAVLTSGAHLHMGWVTKSDALEGIMLVGVSDYVHDIRGVDDQQVEIACGADDDTGFIYFQDYSRNNLGFIRGDGLFNWDGSCNISADLNVDGITNLDTVLIEDRTTIDVINAIAGAALIVNHIQDISAALSISITSILDTRHTLGTIALGIGYFGGFIGNSDGDITQGEGVRGNARINSSWTPNVTLLVGVGGSIDAEDATVLGAASIRGEEPEVDAGSIGASWAGYFEGDVGLASDKKLVLEGNIVTKGNSYLMYNSATTDIDLFVNGVKVITWDNDLIDAHVDLHFDNAKFLVFDKASGNGIKVDTVTPTFGWRDLLGDQFAKNTGGTKPTLVTYNGDVDAWQFSNGDEAFLTYHIPHDYVAGTDIHLHVHWSQNNAGATGGTVDFKYFAIYAKGHNQVSGSAFTGTPITDSFSSIDINDGDSGLTRYQQHLTEVIISGASATAALFDRDALEPDGVIELTLEMDATNLTGTPSDPFIHYVDIHYQSTNIGTKDKAPDFYA